MKESANVLSGTPGIEYHEEPPAIDAAEFQKVIDSRRAVRMFEQEAVPEDVVARCLANGLLAPNSSNLQPWEFYRVKNADTKQLLVKACLNQTAAREAAELIVVVARTATWRAHAAEMLALFKRGGDKAPRMALTYYGKVVPFVYSMGLMGLLGPVKRAVYFFRGLFAPTIREPVSKSHLRTWAVKTAALAAQTIMLSFRAYGYDSCPMEGYDSKMIRRILSLPRDAVVVMVIAAGKRAKGGIWGPRIRFDPSRFIKTV